MSYKNRRYGLTSLEKMNIKSMCEKIETLCNISTLTGKGMCNIYMESIIADDSSPRTKIRIANEWAYGITENLYKILKWSYALRIRQNKEVSYYYLTATILRNAHCTLYGNQISQYFNCYPPSLEEYFGVV
jgi:hypothetical protein